MSRPAIRQMEMLEYIRANPGQTRTEIARGMGLGMSADAVANCTKRMLAESMVKATGDGKGRVEKRWYAVSKPASSMGHAPMFRRVSSIFEVRP